MASDPPERVALLTGGAGFIGHHLARTLLSRGWRVVILDDLSTGRRDNVPTHPRLRFLEGSILEGDRLRDALSGVDAVFHLAAQVSVPESVANPARTEQINVVGMRQLLGAASDAGAGAVVFTSSCAVYGDPATLPVDESTPLAPMSPYADSKRIGEELGYAAAAAGGPGFAALRLFNVYGPEQDAGGAYAAVIAAFASRAVAGTAPTIFGDGLQTRDFVYVEDVVAALIGVAEHVLAHGAAGPFNVGTGDSVSLIELWTAVAEITGADPAYELGPARDGDILHSRSDPSAIEREVGWAAKMPLAAGLRRMLDPLENEG